MEIADNRILEGYKILCILECSYVKIHLKKGRKYSDIVTVLIELSFLSFVNTNSTYY